jgi:hypothetical protein
LNNIPKLRWRHRPAPRTREAHAKLSNLASADSPIQDKTASIDRVNRRATSVRAPRLFSRPKPLVARTV